MTSEPTLTDEALLAVAKAADGDVWWKTVVGDQHQPSGEVSVKHLHPLTVKPVYDAHRGTVVADIIAGLIFNMAITTNRERFLVEHANEARDDAEVRAQAAEARAGMAEEALRLIANQSPASDHYAQSVAFERAQTIADRALNTNKGS